LARRLASPLFLPAASSCHEVLTVAQLDKTDAASAEAYAARPDKGVLPRGPKYLHPPPPSPTSPTYLFLCRDCAQTCGWGDGEKPDASSALGSDEAGNGDMDKATYAAIARANEVDRATVGAKAARQNYLLFLARFSIIDLDPAAE
jgi:hypothetical protein